ncbi:LLM class flavin-dependent oxidoreductase [Nocardia sp. CDC159]|uniref:LLM class flavin-dependent oxidoreductase n=1 Tax=Nocardia pulmonis TaxID=2951408 RepID=A0A9X2E3Z7_9NOCA|nr:MULTISPECIES: LLM class flavin-dependent oxidoreductase [Nocardia]MCM6773702.1 LLM class flavin-dependent oxidoreductase [Nocardia pulmonis]MCM6786589.1 LLM class flavin-dependent oxidoreductase [Nocardia sp. CDC159]
MRELRAVETATPAPVMIAAGGPRSRRLAGRLADIVTLAHNPLAAHADIARMITEIAEAAGDRSAGVEYHLNVIVVGDLIPRQVVPLVGDDLHALTAADSLFVLRGTPQQMADDIQRRRDEFGHSYVTVNHLFLEQFAPVVELLHGR